MQEPQHYRDYGGWGALETLEEDGRCDNGRAGEEYIVGRSDEGSVEKIQGFLLTLSAKLVIGSSPRAD